MPDRTPSLFDLDDLPAAPTARSLVLQATRGRPLSKAERAFNAALARLQALGRGLDEEKRRLDRLIDLHVAEVAPRLERAGQLRAALLRALVPFLDDRRLKDSQRRVVRDIVIAQLDIVLGSVEQPDEDIQAIFERMHGLTLADAAQADIEDLRDDMAGMFDQLGLDVEVPDLHAGMSEADIAVAAARLAEQLERAEETAPTPERAPTKRQLQAQARRRQQEQLQKDSLGSVYRRLVKELHPDLEPDPAERGRKNRIMQDVTAAYARRDLHALLGLELEWLQGTGDASRMAEETLRTYTTMLRQQARELESEIQSLRYHPRYAPLLVETPFGLPLIVDIPSEIDRLDLEIAQIGSGLERLTSDEALEEVRGAIREYRAAAKRHARRMPRM